MVPGFAEIFVALPFLEPPLRVIMETVVTVLLSSAAIMPRSVVGVLDR